MSEQLDKVSAMSDEELSAALAECQALENPSEEAMKYLVALTEESEKRGLNKLGE